ncbi:MAG: lysophospholipid acyltransferase family protein [Sulfurospirillaceae bacterium]|nr:lysophospholipid acyltransferase family protein [Sulfurospirillaceae bacterium]
MATLFSKSNRKKFLVWIVPPLAFAIIKLLYSTCKKKYHIPSQDMVEPSLYALWHGELLMLPFAYIHISKSQQLDAIISRHGDGEIIAKVIQLFGGGTIRGSSSKGSSTVLKNALRSLQKGRDIAITPDGPRGPKHSVADGLITLAKLKNVPIVTLNCQPSSYWKMKSWDAFCIPKPFCTLSFYIGEPFYVGDLSLDEAKKIIQKKLLNHAI